MYGTESAHDSASTVPDLSWDFIDGLDVNVPITDSFILPEAAKAAAAKERLKEKNRQAQKRARQRNKVFSKEITKTATGTSVPLRSYKRSAAGKVPDYGLTAG